MVKRDQEIIDSLKKFRVLDRNQLIQLHFQNNKTPWVVANRVLKRLVDTKKIEVSKDARMYNYFPSPRSISKTSTKIPHFKEIANFYLSLLPYAKPPIFEVEFKTGGGKGMIEPDAFMKWSGADGKLRAYFVEIQRSVYTKKQMENKRDLYLKYKDSGLWKEHAKFFPAIILVTDKKYNVDFSPLNVVQVPHIDKFVEKIRKQIV